jgi:undecaprenyl-diphosphatase
MYGTITDAITSSFFILVHWYGVAWFALGLGFAITGCALASLYWSTHTRFVPYSWYHAIALGLAQGCALLPGVSRFGLTYCVARWLRIAPYRAFEISFLIEWPLIVVASIASLSLLSDPQLCAQFLNLTTLLVILIAAMSAWAGLGIVAYLIRMHRLWLFALYMIVPMLLWLLYAP